MLFSYRCVVALAVSVGAGVSVAQQIEPRRIDPQPLDHISDYIMPGGDLPILETVGDA